MHILGRMGFKILPGLSESGDIQGMNGLRPCNGLGLENNTIDFFF